MAFRYSLTMNDPFSGVATRVYNLVAGDFAAARIIADSILAASQGWTDLAIVKEELTSSDLLLDIADINSNIDRGATMQFALGGGRTASVNFPSPVVSTVNTDRSIDLSDPLVLAWTAPFTDGNVTVSDGELVQSVIKGKLDK